MEINKSETNKERERVGEKEICFAYTHAWTRVERQRGRVVCSVLLLPRCCAV